MNLDLNQFDQSKSKFLRIMKFLLQIAQTWDGIMLAYREMVQMCLNQTISTRCLNV